MPVQARKKFCLNLKVGRLANDWISNFCEGVKSFTLSETVYITLTNNYNFKSIIL